MISDKEIIVKLKSLKGEIHPSSTWVDFCRSWLEQKIDIREQIMEIGLRQKAEPVSVARPLFNWQRALVRVWVPATAVILFMVVGPFGLMLAAKNTLPGNFLFPIKVTSEKVRLVLMPKKEKMDLRIEIASNRLTELNQLVENKQGVREAAIIKAVEQLHEELLAVKNQLPAMMETKDGLDEVVKIAQTVIDLTNKIPTIAVMTGSSCSAFASSSCVSFEKEFVDQELSSIQTMEMAKEIIKNIEELSKKELSEVSTQSAESLPQDLR